MRAIQRPRGAREARAPRAPLLARGLSTFYLSVVAWLALWVLLPAIGLRWQPVVITSGSMGPLIQTGDVVLVDRSQQHQLAPGDVITFEDIGRDGALVTHRVVDVDRDDGSYTTRGDANNVTDSTRVAVDNVLGVGRLLVPAVGLPAVWLDTDLLRFLGWTVATLAAVLLATAPVSVPPPHVARTRSSGAGSTTPRGGTSPTGTRRLGARRIVPALLATSAAVALLLALQTRATAAFVAITDNAGNDVTAAPSFDYADVVQADGPFAYWRLGESAGTTASDENGTHDSTYMSGPTLGVTGLINDADTAVDFDGNNDYVAIPNHAAINTGGPYTSRTLELWFRADDVTTRQVLFEEGGASRGLNLYIDSGLLRWGGWNFNNDGPGTPWSYTDVTAAVSTATVYHVVAVFDQAGDRLELFINGSSAATASGIGPLHSHSGSIGLGAMNSGAYFHTGSGGGNGNHFNGVIDEAALYSGTLGASRIASHFHAGSY